MKNYQSFYYFMYKSFRALTLIRLRQGYDILILALPYNRKFYILEYLNSYRKSIFFKIKIGNLFRKNSERHIFKWEPFFPRTCFIL